MQHKNDNGLTYRKMTEEILVVLRKYDENAQLCHESIEDYAKSKKEPRDSIVSSAIAEYLGTTTKEFLTSLRACKKAG